MKHLYIITTDGSCPGNGGGGTIGGWGCVVRELEVDDEDMELISDIIQDDVLYQPIMKTTNANANQNVLIAGIEPYVVSINTFSGVFEDATNNRAELLATIHGLKSIPNHSTVYVRSDSELTINCINGLYKRKANMDLWAEYGVVSATKTISAYWIKGHKGDIDNNTADQLATTAVSNYNLNSAKQMAQNMVELVNKQPTKHPTTFDELFAVLISRGYAFSCLYEKSVYHIYIKNEADGQILVHYANNNKDEIIKHAFVFSVEREVNDYVSS